MTRVEVSLIGFGARGSNVTFSIPVESSREVMRCFTRMVAYAHLLDNPEFPTIFFELARIACHFEDED